MKYLDKDKIWIMLMNIGAKYGCHQNVNRSFSYRGYQFPVCARCTGILVSTLMAYMTYRYKKVPVWTNVLMISSMVTDGLLQYLGIKESNNKRRFFTGCFGGFGFTTLRLYGYTYLIKIWKEFIQSNPPKKSKR